MTTLTARRVTDPAEIQLLRLEMTAAFVEIDFANVNNEGLDDDEHYAYSDLYGAYDENGNVVGGCRLIHWHGVRLPAFTHDPLYPESEERVSQMDHTRIAEVGRLISIKGRKSSQNFAVTAALYQAMWQDVVRNTNIDYFVAHTMPILFRRLERMKIYFEPLGEPAVATKYNDGIARQAGLLDLKTTYLRMKEDNPEFLALFADGLNPEVLVAYDEYCVRSTTLVAA